MPIHDLLPLSQKNREFLHSTCEEFGTRIPALVIGVLSRIPGKEVPPRIL
jgi:hypothetical protein